MLIQSNWPPAHVYGGMWIGLPREVKLFIAKEFGITPSQATHVSDGVVISDGYSDKDLSVITAEALQKKLKVAETDLFKLWQTYIAHVGKELSPKKSVEAVVEETKAMEINIKIEGGEAKVVNNKPKTNAKKATNGSTTPAPAAQDEGAVA